jgi:membrane protein implicated in regulation of membrane protease activity
VLVLWLVLTMALLAFELHHLAFFALFMAAGTLAAAIVALLAPGAIVIQVLVSLGMGAASTAGLRPLARRAYERRRIGGTVARGVHGGLVGHEALTSDIVGDKNSPGHVRLAGERWLAATAEGHTIEAGAPVIITGVNGTTLSVIASAEIESPDQGVFP